jgi:hypothetical protein
MATAAVRSEPQAVSAAPAAAGSRRSASTVRQAVLQLQRTAGNAAVTRAIAPRAIQRCGTNCGCTTCGSQEEELLDERMGAGLLRSAVAARSSG